MRDLGTGIAIGVATDIIANELSKPTEPPKRQRKPKSRSGGNDDGGKPRKPPVDPLLNAGPPKFTWYGFDIFSNGDVRAHEEKPGGPPAVASPPAPPLPPAAPKAKKDEKPTKCIVLSANLKYAGQLADAPLELPAIFTAPVPGTIPANRLGPSDGPVPNTDKFFAGNVFEYHSDLNGVDDCKSNQYKVAWLLAADKATDAIKDTLDFPDPSKKTLNFDFNIATKNTNSWKVDGVRPGESDMSGRDAYAGHTRSGRVSSRGVPYFEGTRQKIHWVDAPGWEKKPEERDLVAINVALLRSQTFDGDGKHGWFCLSGHTIIVDYKTARPVSLADAKKALSTANGNDLILKKNAATVLNAGAAGLTANPEFLDLGCYKF